MSRDPRPFTAPHPGVRLTTSIAWLCGVLLTLGLGESLYREVLLPGGPPSWLPLAGGLLGVAVFLLVLRFRSWLYHFLSSVRASVILLLAFTLACLAGSFLLQERDLEQRGIRGEKAYRAFQLAEAGFVYHLTGGGNVEVPRSENEEEYFELLRERYGAEFATRRARMFEMSRVTRQRDREIEALADDHDAFFRALWVVCRYTRLGDVHRAWWFKGLMALLAISLLLGTWKHLSFRVGFQGFVLHHLGFVLNHLGFVLLMLGFAVSIATEERGLVPLRKGQTARQAREQGGERPIDLGFQLTLEDFYTEHHHELFTFFRDVDTQAKGYPSGLQRSLKARPGKSYELWGGKYRISVVDAADYGNDQLRIVPSDKSTQPPAIELEVQRNGATAASGWLFARKAPDSVYADPSGAFRLTFLQDAETARLPPAPDVWGLLQLQLGDLQPLQVPVRLGSEVSYGEKRIRIVDCTQDFSRRTLPLEEQSPGNPAVLLEISQGDEEPARRWSFAWHDFDQMHAPPHPELEVRFHFLPASADPTRDFRFVFHQGSLQLTRFDVAGQLHQSEVQVGEAFPLGVDDLSLQVSAFHPSAREVHEVVPIRERDLLARDRSDPHAGHDHNHGNSPLGPLAPDLHRKFHPPGPPAVKLRIEHPGGVEERWFLSGHPENGTWSDGVLHMQFGANQNKVKEWRSLLRASDGHLSERQMVRVNHPMSFQGWTLYQHDANPEHPDYSGIMAIRDPGWYLIEPALYILSCGIMFLFWVKPWLSLPEDPHAGDRAPTAPGRPRPNSGKSPTASSGNRPAPKKRSKKRRKSRKGGKR